jgi:hypothetical protein
MKITRAGTARVCDFALRLARRRKAQGLPGRVTNVDKANVFTSMAFWRQVFDRARQAFPDVQVEHAYVDAMALNLVMKPWDYDVLVTENMFGDILSDLIAALAGGMGMAPSADIGDHYALFQPAHGTAPDIAGQGIANPTATVLSAAMMLDWLAERHGDGALAEGARAIEPRWPRPSPKAWCVRASLAAPAPPPTSCVPSSRGCEMNERIVMVGAGYWAQFQVEGWRDAARRWWPLATATLRTPRRWRSATACRGATATSQPCSTPNGRRWSTWCCPRWHRRRPCARP